MKTSKPISCIGWCSVDYTKMILSQLIEKNVLSFWAFIQHKPEVDGEKVHCHIFVIPSKHVDTQLLSNCFSEPVENSVNIGVSQVWQKSDFKNWYLYGLHDKAFLDSKRLMRIFEYRQNDFITSSWPDFLEMSQTSSTFDLKRVMVENASKCVAWHKFVNQYFSSIPLPQLGAIKECYITLLQNYINLDVPVDDFETLQLLERK